MLKLFILFLFVLMLISLSFGFYFLMKDQGEAPQQRLLTSLKFRISLAVLILLCLIIGFATGTLHSQAPW